jgi:Flp pilus assembly protein TadD
MAPQAKHNPVEAERLKALGNELYQKGEYEPARHKFTQAIEKDPTNAILYANRAAALLATKEYVLVSLVFQPRAGG